MKTKKNMLRSAVASAALCLLPFTVTAQETSSQEPAVLIADDLRVTADDKLIATGNVEALHNGRRLNATQATYDRKTDSISLSGPITVIDEDGNIVTAESGTIDRDLEKGLLYGARALMDAHVQLAANEMHRVNGRYTQLYKASVTSCRICNSDSAPLWQIRAVRVIHDQEERQLYFEDAHFRVLDIPIMYVPRLRLPDPTLDRATGFLIPTLTNSSTLGFGLKLPYFIKIGDDKDLTLTPFIATRTTTLEYRYRQAFENGGLTINGAFSKDKELDDKLRFYMFADARFDISNDFVLRFDVEAARDETYLLDYSYSDKDRLDSEISVERVRRDEHVRAALTYYHSLRDGESNKTLPTLASNMGYERRFFPDRLGGELRLSSELHSHWRRSDRDVDGADYDSYADGRDVARLNLSADWQRQWITGSGIVATLGSGLSLGGFHINQAGDTSKEQEVGATPYASVQLRWPWQTATQSGAVHVLEPTLQANWIGGHNLDVPDDESARVELDEGNLFAVSRFAAPDRWERGATGAYGLSWTRFDPKGWEASLAAGQVWRDSKLYERDGRYTFSRSSGLRDEFSDVLFAAQFRNQKGMALTARSLWDNGFDLTKAEARASWRNKRAKMAATYIWLPQDLAEDRDKKISEWSIDAAYRVSRHWTINGEWRYDIAQDESVRAEIGARYTNECVDIALSGVRRFTSSTNLDPSTDINLTVALRGFTAKTRDGSFTRRCRK